MESTHESEERQVVDEGPTGQVFQHVIREMDEIVADLTRVLSVAQVGNKEREVWLSLVGLGYVQPLVFLKC